MIKIVLTTLILMICFQSSASLAQTRISASATVSISLTIPAKHWRQPHQFSFQASTPQSVTRCINAIPGEQLERLYPSRRLSQCVPEDKIELERIGDKLLVTISAV